jgi:hypothetical protein
MKFPSRGLIYANEATFVVVDFHSIFGMCIRTSPFANIAMTTYFGLWKINLSIPPPQDPKVELQMNLAFQAMMKRDLESGVVKEVHTFLEGGQGYFLSGDVPEDKLHEALQQWSPYVTFELHKTIPTLKSIENAISISRARAAMTVPA